MATPQIVTVIAPANLGEGYTFPAHVDGIDFTVTVPEGGVKEGQSFEVPYPVTPSATAVPVADPGTPGVAVVPVTNPETTGIEPLGAPRGRWRNDVCDCCSKLCDCLFWQAWCCTFFLYGQLAQRMKLDPCGSPGDYKSSCSVISFAFVTYYCLCLIGIGLFAWPYFYVYLVILGMNIRYNYRRKYDIPPSCFHCADGRVDDCCFAYWCTCCIGIQMARHTHNERQYPYFCCTETGLPTGAPEIV